VVEQILKLVAPKVHAVCQAGRVFRVSGEELTLLFHQPALEALVELEQIRKGIESTSLFLRDTRRVWENTRAGSPGRNDHALPITVSIGVADAASDKATLSVVIKAAYRALYEAKAAGGNAVKRAAAAESVRRAYTHSAPVTSGGGY
jgi:diguanylate cyclase (GGDEF)-like protein